jgi:hypothetical protein
MSYIHISSNDSPHPQSRTLLPELLISQLPNQVRFLQSTYKTSEYYRVSEKSMCTCAKRAQHCAGSAEVPYTKQLRWHTLPSSRSPNPVQLRPLSLLWCTSTTTSTLMYTLLQTGAEELISHPPHSTKQHFHHLCSKAQLNSTTSTSFFLSFFLSLFLSLSLFVYLFCHHI